MKQFVFVYGSLKRGYWNNRVLSRATFVSTARTVGSHFTMYDGAFPYVVADGLFAIRGEVFEVTDEDTLRALDRLEGVPTHYMRKEVSISWDIEPDDITCLMYVASPETQRYLVGRPQVKPNDNGVCEWQGQ